MGISMENYNKLIKVTAAYDWIEIIDCKVEEDRYGLKGYIKWNTERNEAIKTVSSIHLDQNPAFKRYFRWKI